MTKEQNNRNTLLVNDGNENNVEEETEGKILELRKTVQITLQVLKIFIVSSSYIEFSCINLSNLSFLLLGLWPNNSTLGSGYEKNCVCLKCSQIKQLEIELPSTP